MTDPRGRAPLDAALEEAQRLDRYLWAGLLFSAAIFAKFPALDLLVSSRYHHPERGFVLGEAAWVQALHAWTPRVGLTSGGPLAAVSHTEPAAGLGAAPPCGLARSLDGLRPTHSHPGPCWWQRAVRACSARV